MRTSLLCLLAFGFATTGFLATAPTAAANSCSAGVGDGPLVHVACNTDELINLGVDGNSQGDCHIRVLGQNRVICDLFDSGQ